MRCAGILLKSQNSLIRRPCPLGSPLGEGDCVVGITFLHPVIIPNYGVVLVIIHKIPRTIRPEIRCEGFLGIFAFIGVQDVDRRSGRWGPDVHPRP